MNTDQEEILPEMQDIFDRMRKLENERERSIKGIRCFTSRPHQFPLLVDSGPPLEEMAILKYEELLLPLRDKLKMLISPFTKDAHIEEMRDIFDRMRKLENERERSIKDIRCFTSRPHQFPLLVDSGPPLEEMAILKYEELLLPLRDKLKMLIGGSAKDAH